VMGRNRVLIANRGEIARRIMRTARRLGYECVAVFSDPDEGAPFVAEADLAVRLPGALPAETYMNQDAIVAAAKRTGARLVHPGYGFLSENPSFAERLEEEGMTFIGPPAPAMRAMSSKLEAKGLARSLGVPVLEALEVRPEKGGPPDPSLLSYPLLVKAAMGGGGKGMRVVHSSAELTDALSSASREAAYAFGDSTLFLEPYLERAKHLEVQVLADGKAFAAVGERECSIQRSYQKLIEECPSPSIDDDTRHKMHAAAEAIAAAVGYRSAGTVEFVYADGRFYFLEMNTRLQVEHPTTEEVFGIDIVELQFRIAEGEPLELPDLSPRGWAIEARLCAEDPLEAFRASTGRIELLRFPEMEGLRVDSGFESGSAVTHYYDSLLAKLIAWGPTRGHAAALLARALKRTVVSGVKTNRLALAALLESQEFLSAGHHTALLSSMNPAELETSALPPSEEMARYLAAAALWIAARNRAEARVLSRIPAGFRNVFSEPQKVRLKDSGGNEHEVRYRYDRYGRPEWVEVDGRELPGVAAWAADSRIHLEVDGRLCTYEGWRTRAGVVVADGLASVEVQLVPRFREPTPTETGSSLAAPMPGTVVKVTCEVGDVVEKGAPLVFIESMKMEHALRSPATGRVAEVKVSPGQQVSANQLLVVIEEEAAQGATHD
jgi:propionyl-CoA carboxylase alpha chain